MCSQSACIRGCKTTLVAFVWLFSTLCFQMCSQSACLRGCKTTLVAFVRLFSTVCFPMSPQIARKRRDIFTLIAFVSLATIFKVIFAMINIHHSLHLDASSFAASAPLTYKERTNLSKTFQDIWFNFQFWSESIRINHHQSESICIKQHKSASISINQRESE